MTRINANIPPADLIDQHLKAEYREMIRIPNVLRKNGPTKSAIPERFTLNKGHVLYFNNKIKFLHKRFLEIKNELNIRQIQNNIEDDSFTCFVNDTRSYNDIDPADLIEGNQLIIERISERVLNMPRQPLFHKKPIDRQHYITLLKNGKGIYN